MACLLEEENVVEETFALIAEWDATTDPLKAALLEARICARSDEIGGLSGFGVTALDGELLVVCLDKEQACAIQMALLTTGEGVVAYVSDVAGAGFEDFIHPQMNATDALKVIFEGRS